MKIIVSNNLDLKKYNHKKAASLNSYNYRNKKNGYDNKEINIDFTQYNFYKKIDFEIDKKRFQDYKKNNSMYNTNRLITNLNGVWTFKVTNFNIRNQKDRIKIANILINYLNNVITRNLKDKKGNFIYNLLGYQLHLDEKNPHIHFQISTWNYLKNKYDKKGLTDPNMGLLNFKKIKNEENEYLNWLQQTKGYKYIKNIQNNKAVKILQSFRNKIKLFKEKENKLFYSNLSLSINNYKNTIDKLNNFINLLKKYENNKKYFQKFEEELNKLLNLFLNLDQRNFTFLWMFINYKEYTKKIISIFNENNKKTKANLFEYLLNKTNDMKKINKKDINEIIKEISI